MSKAERLLSYSLLSLITTKPIATLPNAGVTSQEDDPYSQSDLEEDDVNEEDKPAKKANGCVNEQGAWCWREACEGTFSKPHAFMRFTVTSQIV
jgi:sorting nexin-9/18/33